jgi:hypothetical protein
MLACFLQIWIAAAEGQGLDVERHVRQVADGLLPAVTVRGQAPPKMSILDLLQEGDS